MTMLFPMGECPDASPEDGVALLLAELAALVKLPRCVFTAVPATTSAEPAPLAVESADAEGRTEPLLVAPPLLLVVPLPVVVAPPLELVVVPPVGVAAPTPPPSTPPISWEAFDETVQADCSVGLSFWVTVAHDVVVAETGP